MNYEEIIAIHQLYIDRYKVSAHVNHMKHRVQGLSRYADISIDNFIDTLVDSGKEVKLAYLRKAIPQTELEEAILKENLALIVFLQKEGNAYPVFVFSDEGKLNVNNVLPDQPAISSSWTDDILPNVMKDQAGQFIVVSSFPLNLSDSPLGPDKMPTIQSVLARFYNLLVSEKREIGHLYIYAFLSGFISLSLPLGIQSIINFVSSGQITTSVVVLISLIVIGTLLSGALSIMQLYLVEYIQKRVFAKTAFEFTYRIPRLKIEALLNAYPPELMNRFFDVVTLQKGLAKILIDFSAAVLQIIFGLILLTLYHPMFIMLGGLIVLMIVLVIRFTSNKGIQTSLKESKYKYQLAHWLEEMSRAISTFKLAGFTNLAMDKTDGLLSNYLYARRQHFKVLVIQYSAFTIFKTLMTAGLLILGSYLLIQREINLGQFVASEIIIILIMNATEKIIMQLETVYDVLTSTEKLGVISDLPLEDHQGSISLSSETKTGIHVLVRDLYYRYPSEERDTLHDVSFEVKASESLCIAGYKNSGKKTLMNVVLGILQEYKGVVAFNGLSFRDVNRNSLISHTGDNISQEDIFDGTILENITLGRSHISIEDVSYAVEKSGLSDYILSLPEGLNEPLKKGMMNMPSVLMHKIIFARNIVHKPSLLILDDVFDGIKREEKNKIMDFIFDPKQTWTIIILSDDQEVMKRCHSLLLMKAGTVIYNGAYDEQLNINFGEIL
ncbi:MAG: xenobiotic-transporting ATPase [Cytophagaceae bacterium]|jgi:ABC-type bacteriocin/lantibiotic exporter with double-glycine peptidase domain|nr:xenobiotic-transporting ATPase [Cytophagaceae bacterium]